MQITIKDVTGKKDWYPVYKTSLVFAPSEAVPDWLIARLIRTLKDGTRKYHTSAQFMSGSRETSMTPAEVLDREVRFYTKKGYTVSGQVA